MSAQAWGAILGLVAAVGLLALGSWLRARRPLDVARRVGPYLGVRVAEFPVGPVATLRLLLRPVDRSTRRSSADRDRLEQVAWSGAGACAGAGAGGLLVLNGSAPIGVLILGLVGAVTGYLARDRMLTQQARRRRERIEQQLPTVAELLAFAVAAGESPVSALERVATTTTGELPDEIESAVADIRSGVGLESALHALSDRIGSRMVERFVDGIVIAMERGTPLTEVLRAQAADARADERRRLMELAGRKDVLMLIPVVFLILPTVVLIALFPGIQGLRLIVP